MFKIFITSHLPEKTKDEACKSSRNLNTDIVSAIVGTRLPLPVVSGWRC